MRHFRGGLNPGFSGRGDASQDLFLHEHLDLTAGHNTIRLQVQMSPFAQSETATVSAMTANGLELARDSVCASDGDALSKADTLTLRFELAVGQTVTFEGRVSANASTTHLRFFTQVPVPAFEGHEEAFNFYPSNALPKTSLRFLVIGTTAVCNANCSHCPTNKAYSRTQARGVMDMELFERIVRELAASDFRGTIAFGLFGEPLQDPLLPSRVAMIRDLCPNATISLSTNAALYDPDKHRETLERIDDIAVHIEALTPAVYETVMKPLKVRRTFPRAEQLIADQAGRVHVVSPVHRENLDQIADLKQYWENRGAGETELIALSNRSGQSPNYDALALAPTAVGCGPEMVITELVVDWDGAVLTCCQDFHRHGRIGDLRHETISQTMENLERSRVKRLFNEKRWGELKACAACKLDSEEEVARIVSEHLSILDRQRRFPAKQFRIKGAGRVENDKIVLDSRNLSGILGWRRGAIRSSIYGPHRRLTPGRYLVHFEIDREWIALGGAVAVDITNGVDVLARSKPARKGPWVLELNVAPDAGKLEFRVHARSARLTLSGVTVERQDSAA